MNMKRMLFMIGCLVALVMHMASGKEIVVARTAEVLQKASQPELALSAEDSSLDKIETEGSLHGVTAEFHAQGAGQTQDYWPTQGLARSWQNVDRAVVEQAITDWIDDPVNSSASEMSAVDALHLALADASTLWTNSTDEIVSEALRPVSEQVAIDSIINPDHIRMVWNVAVQGQSTTAQEGWLHPPWSEVITELARGRAPATVVPSTAHLMSGSTKRQSETLSIANSQHRHARRTRRNDLWLSMVSGTPLKPDKMPALHSGVLASPEVLAPEVQAAASIASSAGLFPSSATGYSYANEHADLTEPAIAAAEGVEGDILTRTTSYGVGADAHVRGAVSSQNYGDSEVVTTRNQGNSVNHNFKDYFRFDLTGSGLDLADATSVTFEFVTLSTRFDVGFEFFAIPEGLPGDALDGWAEMEITYDSAPGNHSDKRSHGYYTEPPGDENGNYLVSLGSVSDLTTTFGGVVSFSSASLLDLVKDDANGVITLALVRIDNGSSVHIASKENLLGFDAPRLVIDMTMVPEPSALALCGLGMLVICARATRGVPVA